MGWGWIFPMFVFWGSVVGVAIWGINKLSSNRVGRREDEETPIGIARKRLARGEITTEQFEELREVLGR
jgi:uncharacterized membrane protein